MKEEAVDVTSTNVPSTDGTSTDVALREDSPAGQMELALFGTALPAVRDLAGVETFGQGSYLPTIQLVQGISPEVNAPYHYQVGSYLKKNGKDREQLGKTLEGVILDWRPRAVHFIKGAAADGSDDMVVESYDFESPEFQNIQAIEKAGTKDAQNRPVARWGWEFLIYLADRGEYVIFYANSPSTRYTAQLQLFNNLRRPLTFSAKLEDIKGKRVHSVQVTPSNVPFAFPPNPAELVAQINRFQQLETKDAAEVDEPVDPAASAKLENL